MESSSGVFLVRGLIDNNLIVCSEDLIRNKYAANADNLVTLPNQELQVKLTVHLKKLRFDAFYLVEHEDLPQIFRISDLPILNLAPENHYNFF